MASEPKRNPQVLIVEDNPIISSAMKAVFVHADHLQAKIVHDGKGALEAWEKGNFDIILLDLILPDMDGLEVSKKIRGLERLKGCKPIPIIAFSVLSKEKWGNKCLAAGIDDFIEKPSDLEEVVDIIYKYLPNA